MKWNLVDRFTPEFVMPAIQFVYHLHYHGFILHYYQ